jgi:hypothetical protein
MNINNKEGDEGRQGFNSLPLFTLIKTNSGQRTLNINKKF